MTPDRDTTRIVRSWLETGATDLPERVLDKVLDQLPATPQRRRRWQARRFTQMNSTFKVGIAAAAAVLIGVVGINMLPGSARTGMGAPASLSPSPSPSASSQPIPAGQMMAGRYHIEVPLYSFPSTTDGTVDLTPGGVARVSFDVPPGWSGEGGYAVLKDGEPEVGLVPHTIDRVYLEPCSWIGAEARGDIADPPLRRTLDGLAEALTAWWGVGFSAGPTLAPGSSFPPTRPIATKPTNVTFAGLDGRYVEVRTPTDLDIATCDEGKYVMWEDAAGGQRWTYGPGAVDRLWIVEVDSFSPDAAGGLLVIDAASQPGTSPEGLAELQAIVDSIEIELLPGS